MTVTIHSRGTGVDDDWNDRRIEGACASSGRTAVEPGRNEARRMNPKERLRDATLPELVEALEIEHRARIAWLTDGAGYPRSGAQRTFAEYLSGYLQDGKRAIRAATTLAAAAEAAK